jgi:hypothetical protein
MIVNGILYTHNNNNNNSNNMQKRKWNENLQVDDSSPDTTTAIHHKPFCCILVCKIQVTQVPSPFDSTEKVLDPEESLWQHSRWFVIVSHESCVCKKHWLCDGTQIWHLQLLWKAEVKGASKQHQKVSRSPNAMLTCRFKVYQWPSDSNDAVKKNPQMSALIVHISQATRN